MYRDLASQIDYLEEVLRKSPLVSDVLRLAPRLELPNWYLGAGAIAQTVWNELHGFPLEQGILDCDLVYYDEDTSYEAQEANVRRGAQLFGALPGKVDIVNEARVHLWYKQEVGKEIRQYCSTEDAISTWPTTATSVGVRYEGDKFVVFAPYGLDDLLNMVVRPNKGLITKEIYEKKATRWREVWPKLTVIDW
jgi:hypothetical protein